MWCHQHMALNGGQQSCGVLDSVGVLFEIEILLFFLFVQFLFLLSQLNNDTPSPIHTAHHLCVCVCGWNDNITIFSRLFECFICLGWCWTWLCRRSDDAIRLFACSNNSRPRISATSFFFPRYYWTLDWQLCESSRLIALCVFGRRRFSSFNTNFAGHQSLLTGDGQTFVVTAHPWRENPPSPQLRSNSISSLFLVVPVLLSSHQTARLS